MRPGETLLYDDVDGQVARQSRVVLMWRWLMAAVLGVIVLGSTAGYFLAGVPVPEAVGILSLPVGSNRILGAKTG